MAAAGAGLGAGALSPQPGTLIPQHSPAAGGQHTERELLLDFEKQSTFVCVECCFSNTKASGTRETLLAVGHLFAY